MEASGELVQDSLPLLGLPTEHQGLEEAPARRPESGPGGLLPQSPAANPRESGALLEGMAQAHSLPTKGGA